MILHAVEAGEGPSLVLLHGLFGSAQNFASVQRQLARRFRCIALDLRNHGSSPHADGMRYQAMAADVLATLVEFNATPTALLGHSMGGKVAMRAALERPDAVSALIVADIAPVAYPPHFRAYVAAMRGLPLTPGLTRAQADVALAAAVPDPAVRGFLLQNLSPGVAPTWRIGLAEIAAGMPDIEAWPASDGAVYTGPALFLAGETSDYIKREHRPAIRALFPSARFVTIRHAGHWLHADNPAGFIRVVETFLDAAHTPPPQ